MKPEQRWQDAKKGKVHEELFQEVSRYERDSGDYYERLAAYDAMYDPSLDDPLDYKSRKKKRQIAYRNFVATNVDTVHATLTAEGIRPRFLTEGAPWSTQRRAVHMSWYAEALVKLYRVRPICAHAIKIGALKADALVKVYADPFDRLCVEAVNPDDIVLNPDEEKHGRVRQMHHALVRSVDEVKGEYPQHALAIEKARGVNSKRPYWAGWRKVGPSQMAIWESWYLPVGVKDKKGYKPGRHTICGDGIDLLDEPWEESFFPFAEFCWSKKPRGKRGIGLAERLEGHQRTSDKFAQQVDLMLDKHAVPTTYLSPADAHVAIATTNRAGTFIVTRTGQPPVTVTPAAVSPEIYQRETYIEDAAHRDSGVSRLTANAMKPAGINSGVGLREYKDATSERFAPQEHEAEFLFLQTIVLMMWVCKKLGKAAPVVTRDGLHGPQTISWPKVEITEVAVQVSAASTLPDVSAGRSSFVLELAQGGVISQEMARKLIMPNSPLDVQHELSLYTSAMESADKHIQTILDGGEAWPTPYQNHKMNVWRGESEYNNAETAGAPEKVLFNLEQWINQSAWLVSQAEMPAPGAAPGAMPPGMPPGPGAEMAPALPAGPEPLALPPGGDPGAAMAGAGVTAANLLGA